MISWIQNRLIRHGRWIFLLLLGVIIVAFVFTIGNTPGCARDRTNYQEREFYGYDLNAPRIQKELGRKTSISIHLQTGRQASSDQRFQSRLMSRVALLTLADKLGIPPPAKTQLREYIKTQRAFMGPDGNFSPDAYTRYLDQLETNPQISEDMITRVLKEDYRIQQARQAIGGPGYVMPPEALAQIERNQTTFSLVTATYPFSEFQPEIETEESELKEWFNQHRKNYQIPRRVRADAVVFPTERYKDQVGEPSGEELRAHFAENRQKFISENDAEDSDSGEDNASIRFEDVRTSVKEDLVEEKARRLANEAAENFAYTLYDQDIKRETEAYKDLVETTGAIVEPLEPYTEREASDRDFPEAMLATGFSLEGKRYYSDAYSVDEGFALLILRERIDPEIPPYEDVADEVRNDYKSEQRRMLFEKKGEELRTQLAERMEKQNTAFAEAAKDLELETASYESFEAGQPPQELPRVLLDQIHRMEQNELSPMLRDGDNALYVYITKKEIPEIDPSGEELEQALDQLARISSMMSSRAYQEALITKGLPKEELDALQNPRDTTPAR
ncbi:MAG: SurA N-terminal domain-containing protein [Opitutales bacterium]